MNIIETLAYAGLGMASEASDKAKAKFDELVETGKKVDSDGKNYVGDFFKTVDSTKDDVQAQFDKNKEKLEETFPFLKELEEKFMKAKEDLTSKAKDAKEDLTSKAKETKEKITSKLKKTEDAEVVSEEA
jgi:polyhydroxyalkanoate synthesis regulator phasin